ncbi:GMC oxidoreductase-domain-containing protein [Cyathus striatus]|nr:GMC oxidoreductase-domain-containing protein [Cyathus striatus]
MEHEVIYDIIFAGGGTSGCVAAGRLAMMDKSLKILILEAGEHTLDKPEHTQPARYINHLKPGSKTVSFHVSKPSEHVNGRATVTASGRCLGGGSSVNFLMYNRAAASDFNDWETKFENPGWSSKDLIPLLRKTETYQIKEDEPTHGYSGPLKVSYGGAYTKAGRQFLEVAAQYDKERGSTHDPNAMFECNVYGRWPKWIDSETGHRSDVPHHFIYNQRDNKNLHVITGKTVKRVIFEGNRAVGVEYVNDIISNPDSDRSIFVARASRLVVVSAGAFGSPAILERSGVGQYDILKKHGVDVKVDLPGVGENYQDHQIVPVPFLASDDADTLDALFRGDEDEEKEQTRLYEKGKGLIAHNGFDSGIKMRPTKDDLEVLGPAFRSRWESFFADSADKAVIWLGVGSCYLGANTSAPSKYFSAIVVANYPESVGSVHISSREDVNAPYDFTTGFLNDPADVTVLQWGYKKVRELARRLGIYRGEYVPENPVFPNESEAKRSHDRSPVDIRAPDIVYSVEDNLVIEQYIKQRVRTGWHSLGTCAMKPRQESGVVDSHLNVYGVKGLKVVGMSIAPQNVGANTYSTALVIGEKAASIISAELSTEDQSD